MTTNHTPGPWTNVSDPELHRLRHLRFKHQPKQMALVATPKSQLAIDCTGSGANIYEDLANARLIAAAPELLEALKLVLSYTRATQLMDTQAVQVALDTIAKAEGR